MVNRWRMLIVLLGLIALGAGPVRAQLPIEQQTVAELPAPGPYWAFVLDLGPPGWLAGRFNIIDGASGSLLGEVNAGYLSNLEFAPDHSEIYTVDTFYSRGWRGTRTDVVTIFDGRKLTFVAEVVLPPKRLLMVPKRDATGVTPDGRFLLVSNMTPAESVTVVNLKERAVAGEIETPGCTQVLIAANRRFGSMCADGSLLMVEFDDSGKVVDKKQTKPFFNPLKDQVFDQPLVIGKTAWFVSVHGTIYTADIGDDEVNYAPPWSALDATDRAQTWKPGGWQMMAADRQRGLLYVLMHKGGEWTYKQEGNEVWVYSLAKRQRAGRIKLKTPGYSIMVSQGDKPMLFSVAPGKKWMETYSAPDGRFLRRIDGVGMPYLVYGP